MKIKFLCQDSYEAEKLSSIFTLQKDNTLFIKDVVKIIDNEAVVNLKDGSHHSIILKDKTNAQMLEQFFKEIISNNDKVISASFLDDIAFINLKD